MLDEVRRALNDLLNGNVAPADRRDLLQQMRGTLVRARMAVDDMRASAAATEKRLLNERRELDTVRRRRALAEGVKDEETVKVASRFEQHHAERVQIIVRKLDVEQSELALLEREVDEMTTQFKAASAGVGSGLRTGTVDEAQGLESRDAGLESEFSGLNRQQRRAAAEADAEARLAELKRRMGRSGET
ncbi:MAG: hypothetical protein ACT4OZ_10425 [Gemmatimonadota bacterium]